MKTFPEVSRPAFAAVAIGRNEGGRLRRCLQSIATASPLVYVDSGSEDGSCEWACRVGATVINLDLAKPFTAARARNAGFKAIEAHDSEFRYVQFIDGDCEMVEDWPHEGICFLESHPEVAAVAGRRRERLPERSVYNWLCDCEWAGPAGEARSFGGDVMIRRAAFEAVGGYRGDMIAGEEPELAVRLRAAGWHIWRLEREMTIHDAEMLRFGQWWRRSLRGGYAYALGVHLHGSSPERHKVRESRRAWFWGFLLPIGCILAEFCFGFVGALLWLVYPFQIVRLTLSRTGPLGDRLTLAFFQTLAKFPEALGQINFRLDRILGRHRRLIEYK